MTFRLMTAHILWRTFCIIALLLARALIQFFPHFVHILTVVYTLFYALFALSVLAMAAFGPTKLCIFIGILILIHMLKTSQVEEFEVKNVKE